MGNFHSSWFHGNMRRRMGEERTRRVDSMASQATPNATTSITTSASPTSSHGSATETTRQRRYSLRRTVARLRRSFYHPEDARRPSIVNGDDPTNNQTEGILQTQINTSTNSINSNSSGSRRRRLEEVEDTHDTTLNDSQRPRLDALQRAVFTPEPAEGEQGGGNSMYFYFPLPEDADNRVIDDPPSVSRRRSSRLQRAANFIRERLGHETNGEALNSGNPPPPSEERPMVLVRIRQLSAPNTDIYSNSTPTPAPASTPTPTPTPTPTSTFTPSTSTSTSTSASNILPINASTTANVNQTTTNESGGPSNITEAGEGVFQWTIYFVIPRPEETGTVNDTTSINNNTNVNFDANQAVQRAFAVLRAMMSGDEMTFEDWTRLQEMMGIVSRGVSKEQIEAQLPSKAFTTTLGIGISCPICLAEFHGEESVRILPCEHSYHVACIDTWLHSTNNCPLCRQPPINNV